MSIYHLNTISDYIAIARRIARWILGTIGPRDYKYMLLIFSTSAGAKVYILLSTVICTLSNKKYKQEANAGRGLDALLDL